MAYGNFLQMTRPLLPPPRPMPVTPPDLAPHQLPGITPPQPVQGGPAQIDKPGIPPTPQPFGPPLPMQAGRAMPMPPQMAYAHFARLQLPRQLPSFATRAPLAPRQPFGSPMPPTMGLMQ